jgi:hypothetical protein
MAKSINLSSDCYRTGKLILYDGNLKLNLQLFADYMMANK